MSPRNTFSDVKIGQFFRYNGHPFYKTGLAEGQSVGEVYPL